MLKVSTIEFLIDYSNIEMHNFRQTLCVVCHVEVEARTPNQINKSKLHQQSSNEILEAILGINFFFQMNDKMY